MSSVRDEGMSVVDWLLVVLCPLIGCIVGIVRLIQGNKNGGLMIGLSLAFAVLWNIIGYFGRNLNG